jgi:proline dehydrogenase
MSISFNDTKTAFKHRTDYDLKRAYWLFKMVQNPSLVGFGKKLVNLSLKLKLPVKPFMRPVFDHFCGGETIDTCDNTIADLGKHNVGTILDYSVEGKENEADFERTLKETLQNIEKAAEDKNIPFSVFKITGVGEFKLLEKASAGKEFTEKEKKAYADLVLRVEKICVKAHQLNVPVFVDAEESWIQDAIDRITEAMMARFNRETAIVYNTVQLYRHDRLKYMAELLEKANRGFFYIGLKLVRGAYMDKERERAKKLGYPSPIQASKADSDRDFNKAIDFCLDNIDKIYFCAGCHNEESTMHLVNSMKERGIEPSDKRVYSAQLFGMSDHISFNLSEAGYNVAKYVPYGPVKDVIPYLIRRAEENTSIEGQTGRELSLIDKEMERRNVKG